MSINDWQRHVLSIVSSLEPARFSAVCARDDATGKACQDKMGAKLSWLRRKEYIEYVDTRYHVTDKGREALNDSEA